MGFTKKTLHCLGCKAKIASGTVCGHCKPREGEVYLKRVHECIEHERTFNELWTQCQRCQGSLHGAGVSIVAWSLTLVALVTGSKAPSGTWQRRERRGLGERAGA